MKKITLVVLFILTMAQGPCESMDAENQSDGEDTDTVECGDLDVTCNHSLNIEMLLAGLESYPTGMYGFSVVAPDTSEYSIECNLNNIESGFVCNRGNTEELQVAIYSEEPDVIVFHINGAPPYCTVRMEYSGFEVADKELEPEYEMSYPNGKGCKPVCYNGEEHIAIQIN